MPHRSSSRAAGGVGDAGERQPLASRANNASPTPSLASPIHSTSSSGGVGGGLHRSSTVPAHKSSPRHHPPAPPLLSPIAAAPSDRTFALETSPFTRKRLLFSHQRSASTPQPSSMNTTHAKPLPPPPYLRAAPPLVRSSSLPLVATISEGRPLRLATTTTSTSSSGGTPYRIPSPTRQYARSGSPARLGGLYHPGSAFPARASPPSYLVNEAYVGSSSASSSSSPSTPTSLRSRSPSISSLETIEDSPETEKEAEKEAEKERKEWEATEAQRRRVSAVDVGRWAGNVGVGGSAVAGLGLRGATSNAKRKRWSVCGGEKRGDLELETIWEEASRGTPQEERDEETTEETSNESASGNTSASEADSEAESELNSEVDEDDDEADSEAEYTDAEVDDDDASSSLSAAGISAEAQEPLPTHTNTTPTLTPAPAALHA